MKGKMTYTENPKTKDSGIICAIPHTGVCPNNCADCFFQSGRSYLEPLSEHLPNMPSQEESIWRVVRVNDGHDSNVDPAMVMGATQQYPQRFYNTSIPDGLDKFDAPVVLTVNPGQMTDTDIHRVNPIPPNLMFVRVRANTWNQSRVVDEAVLFYGGKVPIVLTFMAYFREAITPEERQFYTFRKRTSNAYWAITTDAWRKYMTRYEDNKWVYSCGKIEGERGTTACRFCGNCLREYFAAMERQNS